MGDWRDWWLNSQAANDLSNLFGSIPNRLKKVLAPEDTIGQQIEYPTNRINYDKLIKPEEVSQKDFLTQQIAPKGRQKDVYIGSSIRPLSTAERMRSWEEDAINKVKQNPISRALGMASDAATAYNDYLGSPIENVNPIHSAAGVMTAAQRMKGRTQRLEGLYNKLYNVLPPGGPIDSDLVSWGARGEFARLMQSHPRVVSELDNFVRSVNPNDGAAWHDSIRWRVDPKGNLTGTTMKDARESNRLREILGQEPMSHGEIGFRPEKWGELLITDPAKRANPDNFLTDWLIAEGKRATGHELTHHAQNLISDTPSRQRLTNGYLRRKYGPDMGYWLDPNEIGARARDFYATPEGKAIHGKSFLDSVIRELNYTISSRYKDPKWKQALSDWAADVLPEMEKRYGTSLMPITEQGQFSQVSKGAKRNSRIYKGQPISDSMAQSVASVNDNNFRQSRSRPGIVKKFTNNTNPTDQKHLDEMMDFIKSGRKIINTVPESQSANFIGDITNGSVRAVPLGNVDPTLIGHDDVLRNVGRGRFRFSDGVVHWTEPPSAAEYFAVEDYLARVGKKAQRHVDAFSKKPIRLPPPTLDEW